MPAPLKKRDCGQLSTLPQSPEWSRQHGVIEQSEKSVPCNTRRRVHWFDISARLPTQFFRGGFTPNEPNDCTS
jgi:hypothetical protein